MRKASIQVDVLLMYTSTVLKGEYLVSAITARVQLNEYVPIQLAAR